jgi:hypothetical protein
MVSWHQIALTFSRSRDFLCDSDLILSTTVALPENRTVRCRELLKAAIAMTDDLIAHARLPEDEERARKGGLVIAQRGSEYFRQLAARRKTRGGGRPQNKSRAIFAPFYTFSVFVAKPGRRSKGLSLC